MIQMMKSNKQARGGDESELSVECVCNISLAKFLNE